MWILVRTALVWLLALALPVQGAAAASMLACGPGHYGAAVHLHSGDEALHEAGNAGVGIASQAGGHHHGADGRTGWHGHSHEPTGGAAADGAMHGGDKMSVVADAAGNHVHKPAGKCSACASCCTVAGLPTAVLPIASPHGLDRVQAFFVTQAAVFMTGGPERPPRPFLA